MRDIIAIKRSQPAEESMKTHFQTTNLIINHLKREGDLRLITEIIPNTQDLKNLVTGSCAIHCYHDMGVRTKNESEMVSNVFNISNFEKIQKKELFEELYNFIGDAMVNEISLLNKSIEIEDNLLQNINYETLTWDSKFIEDFKDYLQIHLIEVLNQYSEVFWVDHVGDLTGLTRIIKNQILSDSGELKATSVKLEERILEEKYTDKTIELSTYRNLSENFKKSFEYRSISDLKLKTFPFRKIISKILEYRLDIYPISKRGLEYFQKATMLKKSIISKFIKAQQEHTDYIEMEKSLIAEIKETLIEVAKQGPNQFIYYLKNLLEQYFENIYTILQRLGIFNLPTFCEVLKIDFRQFYKDTHLYNLDKMSFKRLASPDNPINAVIKYLNSNQLSKHVFFGENLQKLMNDERSPVKKAILEACQHVGITKTELGDMIQKRYIIENLFRKKYPIKGAISNYALIYELPTILNNLSKQIFYTYFQKITRQVARLLECYLKLSKDKDIALFGIKRIAKTSDQSWIDIKIEELVIKRLMYRQKELATMLDGKNKAYLVNGFIFARFFDISLKEAIHILKNEPSPLYQPVEDLPLPLDLVSPVSYVIAYDIFNRLRDQREFQAFQIAQKIEAKKEKSDTKLKKVKAIRQLNTLNWIDRKVTSTLVSVKAISNNPTNLYWTETDNKKVIEDIFQHTQLPDKKICLQCGKDTTINPCNIHPDSSSLATPFDLFAQYMNFAFQRIQDNFSAIQTPDFSRITQNIKNWIQEAVQNRLNEPISRELSLQLIDGEIRYVATKIARVIGKRLDKALYKKFKTNLRSRRS